MDLSTATGTGIFNIFELHWDKEALEMTGIKESQLPKVVEPYEIEENLPHEYAKKMGIQSSTKFIWGAADGPLSNLGVNAIKPGEAKLDDAATKQYDQSIGSRELNAVLEALREKADIVRHPENL